MKREYFEAFLKTKDLHDEWWVSVGADVLDTPMSLDDIAELEYEFPGKSIALMHPVATQNDASEWVPFDFEGMASLQKAIPQNEDADTDVNLHIKVGFMAEQICELKSEVKSLREAIDQISDYVREISRLDQLKLELQNRQSFIEDAESRLLDKTNDYEQQVAELEQRNEDEQAHSMKSA